MPGLLSRFGNGVTNAIDRMAYNSLGGGRVNQGNDRQ
jgi:hypothetical protein